VKEVTPDTPVSEREVTTTVSQHLGAAALARGAAPAAHSATAAAAT
jgi:hypothetical protein